MSLTKMNLSAAAAAGAVLTVLHFQTRTPLKAGDGEPVTINHLGRDSAKVVAKQREQRNQGVEDARNGVPFDATAQDYRDAELLATGMTGWHGVPQGWLVELTQEQLDAMSAEEVAALDEVVPFSTENAITLLLNPGMNWLREQYVKSFDDRGKLLAAQEA